MDRYAVCQLVLRSGDLTRDIEWAEAGGASGIGLAADAVTAMGTAAVVDALADHDLRCSTIFGAPPLLSLEIEPAALGHVEAMITMCVDLGAVGLLLTTGPLGDRSLADADRACADWLAAAAPVAAEAGALLLIEPVHPLLRHISYVHSLRHAAELTAGRPGTGLLADVGHLWWDRSLHDDISQLTPHIGLVQIDDVDGAELENYCYRRTQLGDGVVPLAELISALEASGYRGCYEHESIARVPREARVGFVKLGGERLATWLDGT